MTLLEDLEAAALDYERRAHVAVIPGVPFDLNAIAARLRLHEARLRGIFADPRMVFAFETPDIMRDVFARINGDVP